MARSELRLLWGGRFEKGKLPPPRYFYERELGKLGRPNRKGWAAANCPFHRSESRRSFSVNLNTGAFHCFGCDTRGGDIIDFIRLRDNCTFKMAAKSLGAWSDVTLTREARLQLAQAWHQAERRREAEQQAKQAERERRLALCEEIHTTANIYREANDRLSELRRGEAPDYPGEEEHLWEIVPLALENLRMAETAYMRVCGLEEVGGCQ